MEYVKKFTGSSTEHSRSFKDVDHMKAITWQGGKKIAVANVARPVLLNTHDVIVRVMACSIDNGFATQLGAGQLSCFDKGQILGQEAVGLVELSGNDVKNIGVGDRVVISCIIACGNCSYCKREEYSGCNCTNESKEFAETYGGWAPAAVLGSSRLYGGIPGTNAEFVRVPFADINCHKITQKMENVNALLLSNTMPTALHALDLGSVREHDTVVIWGCGPIGLLTALCCKSVKAERVVCVDNDTHQLKIAYEHFKVEVIDRNNLSSNEVLKQISGRLPDGGADVVVDACGSLVSRSWIYQFEQQMGMRKDSSAIFKECFTAVRKYGTVVILGEYTTSADSFPIGHVMMKHLTVCGGRSPVHKYWKKAEEYLQTDNFDLSVLFRPDNVQFEKLPEMYSNVGSREAGHLKVFCEMSP